ncbi:F0F1 ATP synthase subunit I [Legionella israelensis]|nr:F0F1 ATP synthase subunit I [Legionella israelensis]
MRKQYRAQIVVRVFLIQAVLTLIMAAIWFVTAGLNAAYSSMLGGLVCIIPNVIFAGQAFKYQGARAAKKIVHSFYKAEALKIAMSIVLFATVFIMCDIKPLAFFITYILVQMSHWFAPWVVINKYNRPESD